MHGVSIDHIEVIYIYRYCLPDITQRVLIAMVVPSCKGVSPGSVGLTNQPTNQPTFALSKLLKDFTPATNDLTTQGRASVAFWSLELQGHEVQTPK